MQHLLTIAFEDCTNVPDGDSLGVFVGKAVGPEEGIAVGVGVMGISGTSSSSGFSKWSAARSSSAANELGAWRRRVVMAMRTENFILVLRWNNWNNSTKV
jgi:hypothetical protein